MRSTVVDTNVLVVANGRDGDYSVRCQLAAIETLSALKARGRVGLDELGEIIDEYRRYCRGSGEPGVGDEFFRWVFEHQYTHCERVHLTPDEDRTYAEFPDDPDLTNFDRNDRKFVAVAMGCTAAGGSHLHAGPRIRPPRASPGAGGYPGSWDLSGVRLKRARAGTPGPRRVHHGEP
jgi:hypothetical protein